MKKDGCWMNSEIKTFNFKSLNLWEWMVINNEWTVKEMKLDAECIMTAFNWMELAVWMNCGGNKSNFGK